MLNAEIFYVSLVSIQTLLLKRLAEGHGSIPITVAFILRSPD
uniref:Uncharacterized protein n=1 Tax=Anguilla anguilla TaxID=7936 RepID=A0A0E9U1L9_ANGAN